jgi:DNA-nicking Smr family endonuclease
MSADDDRKIWAIYTKGVKRARRVSEKPAKKNAKKTTRKSSIIDIRQDIMPKPAVAKKSVPVALDKIIFDKKTERQLRQGTVAVDARLDLHGMTQAEAFAALDRFIMAQARTGRRTLLVITGKGRGNEGVLRTNFPLWLENISAAPSVLSFRPAALKHGGTGAFYVMLRRRS